MSKTINFTNIARSICQSNSFELIKKVGQGMFKVTFKVKDIHNQFYALKIYKSNTLDARSLLEIESMKKCNHPNIAHILDIKTHFLNGDNYICLVEDYFGGGTLQEKLGNLNITLSRDEVLDLGEILINAVSHIAALNLVHRDIKPANILFDNNNKPVITDFGLVRDLSATSLTQTWFPQGPCTRYLHLPNN